MMLDTVLSLTVLAAALLVFGAWMLWKRTGNLKNAGLMVLLAIIAVVNVMIWTVPTADGEAPLDKVERGSR
ncbi:hypothetical protein [Qipengyuania aquimaris]|nr:hypothetical protein [Qipengyuania aquimaris]